MLGKRVSKVLATVLAAVFLTVAAVPGVRSFSLSAEAAWSPKYVFYFIGDGLGAAQRQSAEYFLREQSGNNTVKLVMNSFPIAGINTTHSADTLVTDSAAAGTALATGHKTNNGIISKLPNGQDLRTLIEEAEEKGLATGLITTTRVTHATPAVFASHNMNRDAENEIAVDYLDSGVDFIAGGGYRHFVPKDWKWGGSKRTDSRNVLQEFYNKGYKVFTGTESTDDFRSFRPTGSSKVIALFTNSHLPYEIDRKAANETPSIAEITAKGIEVLSKDQDGFFMMVEGGRIDHACHANDLAGTIQDTLAFDKAVAKAYDFYKQHPLETLIVVVGDHETGGMGLGFGKGYFVKMNEVADVKISVEDILQYKYEQVFNKNRAAFFGYIAENCGLDNLTEAEKANISKAMDLVDQGIKPEGKLYGGYDPVAIAVTHVVSERANMYWTTYAHSGTAIPMSAVGVGASEFGGYRDNTEIARTMADVMGLKLTA